MDINWFMETYIHVQDVNYLKNNIPETFKDQFTARNICNNIAFANLDKRSCMLIKVGIQYGN